MQRCGYGEFSRNAALDILRTSTGLRDMPLPLLDVWSCSLNHYAIDQYRAGLSHADRQPKFRDNIGLYFFEPTPEA
jgi:hypothetical protein